MTSVSVPLISVKLKKKIVSIGWFREHMVRTKGSNKKNCLLFPWQNDIVLTEKTTIVQNNAAKLTCTAFDQTKFNLAIRYGFCNVRKSGSYRSCASCGSIGWFASAEYFDLCFLQSQYDKHNNRTTINCIINTLFIFGLINESVRKQRPTIRRKQLWLNWQKIKIVCFSWLQLKLKFIAYVHNLFGLKIL